MERLVAEGKSLSATKKQLDTIQARRFDDVARSMMDTGVVLTFDQADELGDEALDWLEKRLGLRVATTDSGVEALAESEEVSDKLLLHLAAAASQMNIDVGDKNAVNAFFDQIKALVTSDKAALVTQLKKFAGKDAKAVSKKALAEKD
jgi:hypothetical protein